MSQISGRVVIARVLCIKNRIMYHREPSLRAGIMSD
ncbi:ABC-type polar amino acid transport system ATPase subunit [Sinorhizobium meliloti]|nr:hypothetical protein C770_GR4pC1224 [Sinorhizobium meliloti GR4]